jgi:hypothetical protein
MQLLKNPTITEPIRLHTLCWFGHVQRMEENIVPKKVLHMNLQTRRLNLDQEIDGKMK